MQGGYLPGPHAAAAPDGSGIQQQRPRYLGRHHFARQRLPTSAEGSGFSNDADAYQTQVVDVQAWFTAAESLAAKYRMAGKLTLSCAADAQNCATTFIKDIGKKLFRRPLTEAELTSYLARFTTGSTGGTFEEGLEWVLGRMLQSPHFLYRVEARVAGQAGQYRGAARRLFGGYPAVVLLARVHARRRPAGGR